tara:strand:+ start:1687 stop:2226 length:540 start_codon:yes stop_codon:yes gene_type:complete
MTNNHTTKYRAKRKRYSNNSENPNQNVCANRVAIALGVADKVKYLHNLPDLLRATRKKYNVRSRSSLWATKFKGKPFTMNQFLRNFSMFNMWAEDQKSITLKDYWCPDSDEFWTQKTVSWVSIHAYIIHVERHVILINHKGEVHTDTAPAKNTDRRRIKKIYAVGYKQQFQTAITEDEK